MYNKYFQNKSVTYFYALISLLFMHYLGGLPQISSGEQQSCHKSGQIILQSRNRTLGSTAATGGQEYGQERITRGTSVYVQTHHSLQSKKPATEQQTAADMKAVIEVKTAAEQQAGAEFQAVADQNR
jgi:hypothetical protein